MVWIAAALIALGLLVAVTVLLTGRTQTTGVARSLALVEAAGSGSSPLLRSEQSTKDRFATPAIEALRRLAETLSPQGTAQRFTRMLDRAGNPAPWTPDRIMGTKGAAMLIGVLLGLLWGGLSLRGLLATLLLGVFFFFLPDILLANAAARRRDQVGKGLAEAIDMLTVCVEAGQGFDAALTHVSRTVRGPIAGEFARALSEIQIGKQRGEAFSHLAERVSTPEVKAFVTALTQADRLGLPIGRVIREQAQVMRLARRQKAEEKAQKVTVKILFPLMFCILPSLFVVLLAPGVADIIRTFRGLG